MKRKLGNTKGIILRFFISATRAGITKFLIIFKGTMGRAWSNPLKNWTLVDSSFSIKTFK